MGERIWARRLRWRLRGASMWPAFAVAVAVDAVLLQALPIAGDRGPGLFAALLLAGFLNLAIVAVAAPLAGIAVRRRRPGLPKVVADDRAGTALLAVAAAGVAALGLAHRPAVRAAEHDLAAQAAAARRFVLGHAPPEYRTNVDALDTWVQGPDLYRTCVPGPEARKAFCVIVTTDQDPPGVVRDRDQRPNAAVAGPDNPGRR
jgi:hypothetical protein